MGDSRASACRGCGRPIRWIKTKGGKAMPVEMERKTIVTEAGEVVSGFESHFAHCPKAGSFRGRG